MARIVDRFTEAIGFDRYALYVFDYGAPTGFRLALAHPERITAIVSQNGNAYREGLSEGWNPIRAYWEDNSEANRQALRNSWLPSHGLAIHPWRAGYDRGLSRRLLLDNFYLSRPGVADVQLDLFGDYKSNVALYPSFKATSARISHRSGGLGKERSVLSAGGREAFKRDMPKPLVRFFDTGHFALETHSQEIAADDPRISDSHNLTAAPAAG